MMTVAGKIMPTGKSRVTSTVMMMSADRVSWANFHPPEYKDVEDSQ